MLRIARTVASGLPHHITHLDNPVRAGIVKKVEVYRWSSAREHVKGSSDGIVSQRCYLLEEISGWRRYPQEEEDGSQKVLSDRMALW